MKYALISVSDKEGIVEFARELVNSGYKILSTGGTAKLLQQNEIEVQQVSDYTGFPEMMDGRVKTLHPKVHGGILGRRDNSDDQKAAMDNQINWIDLVVVNLYPFVQTVSNPDVTLDEAIEQIDVGGPAMIRAAAKNSKYVTVITDPRDYDNFLDNLKRSNVDEVYRVNMACKAFQHTAEYDGQIAMYLSKQCDQPELLTLHYEKVKTLRYGENPHQKAAFFRNPHNNDANVTNAKILQGKELSFNNIVDADSAIELVKEFNRPAAVFIKHNNPCGVATSEEIVEAFKLAHNVDPLSAFGCVIAVNRDLTKEIVDYIKEQKLFVELIAAPSFSEEALSELADFKNLRLIETGKLKLDKTRRDIKKVAGGILVQTADTYLVKEEDLKIVTKKKPSNEEVAAMLFAQKVVKHVKSNAVVFAKVDSDGNEVVCAIGAGQMSRVDSVYIATKKGGDRIIGSVMASDAFFPFSDSVEQAAEAGVSAILQPGGSIRDDEVVKKADELGLSMVFTGIRNFRH